MVEKPAGSLDRKGGYRQICLALESILGVPAEELFSNELYEQFPGRETSGATEINFTALPGIERRRIPLLPAPQPEGLSELERAKLPEKVGEVLQTLTWREQEVLRMRFGLLDGRTYTLEEAGEILRTSRGRARAIEVRAIMKLRQPSRIRRLESFLD